ncbi:MAG TPA: UbiX family flavin prenyltransferase [Hellea balneolensis]|uniref:Flavin prenyltransferase UbiX n=1 Tax=Hellea balneolensis TaxID=287478 RepID=A0A7C5R7P8_9PROT|nr:UbiX family flavin prenyltransferase [Hellea balneolensis]
MTKRIIIGVTGASGAVYARRMLEMIKEMDGVESHLVVSPPGFINMAHEMEISKTEFCALADVYHKFPDITASIASGGLETLGMVVAPCSVNTLAAIANGICDNLLTRAADVVLKERRRLALMVRESPLHLGHIRNMATVSEIGGLIYPPAPQFYTKPLSIDDLVEQTVAKVLAGFDLDVSAYYKPWQGL